MYHTQPDDIEFPPAAVGGERSIVERRKHRRKPGRRKKDGYNKGKDGPNADRHLCKTCVYRGRHDQVGNCSYIEIEGHSRGIPAAECTVYVKGRKRKALW